MYQDNYICPTRNISYNSAHKSGDVHIYYTNPSYAYHNVNRKVTECMCFHSLGKEVVVGPYSLYKFHESSVG